MEARFWKKILFELIRHGKCWIRSSLFGLIRAYSASRRAYSAWQSSLFSGSSSLFGLTSSLFGLSSSLFGAWAYSAKWWSLFGGSACILNRSWKPSLPTHLPQYTIKLPIDSPSSLDNNINARFYTYTLLYNFLCVIVGFVQKCSRCICCCNQISIQY